MPYKHEALTICSRADESLLLRGLVLETTRRIIHSLPQQKALDRLICEFTRIEPNGALDRTLGIFVSRDEMAPSVNPISSYLNDLLDFTAEHL